MVACFTSGVGFPKIWGDWVVVLLPEDFTGRNLCVKDNIQKG